ncbi:ASCH domain-containing protein [uncultured Cohaesibacter sp.]|uniref:ASCH domain-containing protein n=1 Tax=uncultured Cohaesibacter sp. TaxID=1002546 RepID=UPI002AA68E25|nr:ASCH domain-containing protein [uncultured Cohaesibacter sp.]
MHDIVDSYAMGDTPELADELLALIIEGKKTASCESLQTMEKDNIPLPKVGDKYMLLDGRQKPAAVIETVAVTICRFDEVDETFARAEGEGDLSYEYWRQGHKDYFSRNGGFSEDMKLVCERFRLCEVLER